MSNVQYHYCYGYIISILLLFWLAVITFNVSCLVYHCLPRAIVSMLKICIYDYCYCIYYYNYIFFCFLFHLYSIKMVVQSILKEFL